MGRYSGGKPATQRNGVNPLWAGILVGIVIGAGMAAVVTWYMMKSPSPYLKKQPVADMMKLQPETVPPAASVSEKPRFEFYNVLADNESSKSSVPSRQASKDHPAEKAKPVGGKAMVIFEPHILQVGSFTKAEDAEKLKARLALIGAEAHVQSATVPDKGIYYRVRLGPYKSEEEMSRARNFLKQNELDSTPMRAK